MTACKETIDSQANSAAVPPHSPEAEAAILGAVLMENSSWDSISRLLMENDFYCPEHRLIYSAMGDLISANTPADVITVLEHLERRGKAGEVGGAVYLKSLARERPNTGNRQHYTGIVRECSTLRKLLSAGDQIIRNARNPLGRSVDKILDEAAHAIFSIGEEDAREKPGFDSMDTLVDQVYDRLRDLNSELNRGSDGISGVHTGFPDLDRMIDGLRNGELIVIASQSLADASTLALNIVEHVALREQLPTAVFSMRMSGADVVRRMVCSLRGLELHRLKAGGLSSEENFKLEVGLTKLRAAPLHVYSHVGLTALTLRAEARRLARQTKYLNLIVIDALELLRFSGGDGDDATASSRTCRVLKIIAQELQCPVIVLTQIPQTQKPGQGEVPQFDDHPQAMALQEAADVIMLLRRNAPDRMDRSNGNGSADLVFSKLHDGFTGVVRLGFTEAPFRFKNFSEGGGGKSSGVLSSFWQRDDVLRHHARIS